MGNSNEELVIETKEDIRPYTKNMFTVPFGDKYAKMFHQIFYSPISKQTALVDKLAEEIKQDKKLTDIQKRKLDACVVAYYTAVCEKNISVPVIGYVKEKKPNLSKFMKDKRFKRTVEDLYELFYNNGFEYEVIYFPKLLQQFEFQYTNEKHRELLNGGFSEEMPFQIMIMVAFSRLSRNISITDYATKFYIMMFFQRISQLTYMPTEVMYENPELKDSIINILKTIYIVQRLELVRAGIIKPTEEKTGTEG
jgi:hypothetical protein